MPWLPALTELLHIIAAIAWIGTVLTTELISQPLADRLPPLERRRTMVAHSLAEKRIIRPAVAAVVLLGILRGSLFGPLRSVDALLSTYGLTWLVALLLTLGLYAWGRLMITPGYIRLAQLEDTALVADTGAASGALLRALALIQSRRRAQLVGFGVILSLMVFMGFGY